MNIMVREREREQTAGLKTEDEGLVVAKDPGPPKNIMSNAPTERWEMGEGERMLDIHIHIHRVQPHSGTNGVTRSL